MSLTRGDIKTKILTLVNKNSGYQGFMTDEKINDAIEDCLDYIAMHMFEAGEGWFNRFESVTVPAGTFYVDLPTGCAIVNAVRYLIGSTYVDLKYDDRSKQPVVKDTGQLTQYPTTYSLVNGNQIFLNPAPSITGTDQMQIEYTKYPDRLTSDLQTIDTQFSLGLLQFVKWRAASILMTSVGKPVSDWRDYEAQWFDRMKAEVSKRNRQSYFIKDFDSL